MGSCSHIPHILYTSTRVLFFRCQRGSRDKIREFSIVHNMYDTGIDVYMKSLNKLFLYNQGHSSSSGTVTPFKLLSFSSGCRVFQYTKGLKWCSVCRKLCQIVSLFKAFCQTQDVFPNYRCYLSNIFNVSVSSQLSSPEDKGAIQCLHVVQSLSGSGNRLHLTLFTPCFMQSSPSLTKYSLTFSIL